MHADLESIVCKFGGDPAICLREEAICAKVYRQTDDGRRAIALAHSWNELKIDPPKNNAILQCLCFYGVQMSDFKAKMHQIRFPLSSVPDMLGRGLTALPGPSGCILRGLPLMGGIGGGDEGKRRERGEEGKEGMGKEGGAREKCEA